MSEPVSFQMVSNMYHYTPIFRRVYRTVYNYREPTVCFFQHKTLLPMPRRKPLVVYVSVQVSM